MLTVAVAMLVYVMSEQVFGAGSAAVAVLFFGLTLGNSESLSRRIKRRYVLSPKIKEFHSEITFFVRTFFFVYLGLVASIQARYLIFGVALSIALIVARVWAVRLALHRKVMMDEELNVVKIMVPKGLVAAALTQLPVAYGLPGADIIQNVAFVVIFSTTVFAAIGAQVLSRGSRKYLE
jgi:cell volume regulation protein A